MARNNDKEKARAIVQSMEGRLRDEFARLRKVIFNPNVKGQEYELRVKEFFEPYLMGVYDFHVRCSLLDAELKAFSIFSQVENEFDVVATHKIASPRLVLKTGTSAFVPYDAVAFVISVKQTLSLPALEKDLDKYQKVGQLPFSKLGPALEGKYTIERPMRVLLYSEGGLSNSVLGKLLEMKQVWDILENVSEDTLITNDNLPFTRALAKKEPSLEFKEHSLAMLMLFLSVSIPSPLGLNTGNLLFNLIRMAESE
ncbi:MAG: hypothetical protein KAV43_04215 [Hadesarchaea archaeon]|nr:hypothetical protein [Hadesarchaea archaeon]